MSSIFPKPASLQVRRDPQLQIQVLISLALMLTLAVLIPPQIPPKYSEVGPWGVSYVFDKLIIGDTSCSPFWVNSQSSPLMLQDSGSWRASVQTKFSTKDVHFAATTCQCWPEAASTR